MHQLRGMVKTGANMCCAHADADGDAADRRAPRGASASGALLFSPISEALAAAF